MKVCTKCKKEKKITEFYTCNDCKDGHRNECKSCNVKSNNENRRKRKEKNRARIKEYLGGKYECSRCGFTHTTPSPFAWHHIGSDKDNNIGDMLGFSWENLKRELDKCEFICHNCHMIEHYG